MSLAAIACALDLVAPYRPHAVVGVFGDGSDAILRLHFTEPATDVEVAHVLDCLLLAVPMTIMVSTSIRVPKVSREEQLRAAMERDAARAERRRIAELTECCAPHMSCGGNCTREKGHPPPCWCHGVDENGEETCPA